MIYKWLLAIFRPFAFLCAFQSIGIQKLHMLIYSRSILFHYSPKEKTNHLWKKLLRIECRSFTRSINANWFPILFFIFFFLDFFISHTRKQNVHILYKLDFIVIISSKSKSDFYFDVRRLFVDCRLRWFCFWPTIESFLLFGFFLCCNLFPKFIFNVKVFVETSFLLHLFKN